MVELVWRIVEEDQKIMKGMKEVPETWNISKGELERLICLELVELIKRELQVLQEGGVLNSRQVHYIRGQDTPRERKFYLLPKVHKERATRPFPDVPPGRPIVLDCGSKSYGVAELITSYLNPLSTRHASYIRDSFWRTSRG